MWDKVIFVCRSGTCRAPMAAALLEESGVKRNLTIEAKGLVCLFPEPLNQKASAVMISNGIHMKDYMSSPLKAEDVDDHTLVLVMENQEIAKVLDIIGEERASQVEVLTRLVGEELEIMDPYGAPLPSYGLCFESMSKTIKKLATWFNEQEGDA
ncbi:MAG: phosphotyrosine protein phosphatase [bacterium]|nr:phosphotyrosine protein phosphatase [bacterium]